MRKRRNLDFKIARVEKELTRIRKTLRWAATQLPHDNPEHDRKGPEISSTDRESIGFTDAVREVLRSYPTWLSPMLVRDLLETVGFEISGYQNPLSTVHCLLGRLVAGGGSDRKQVSG